jgi:hypothetical protein
MFPEARANSVYPQTVMGFLALTATRFAVSLGKTLKASLGNSNLYHLIQRASSFGIETITSAQ